MKIITQLTLKIFILVTIITTQIGGNILIFQTEAQVNNFPSSSSSISNSSSTNSNSSSSSISNAILNNSSCTILGIHPNPGTMPDWTKLDQLESWQTKKNASITIYSASVSQYLDYTFGQLETTWNRGSIPSLSLEFWADSYNTDNPDNTTIETRIAQGELDGYFANFRTKLLSYIAGNDKQLGTDDDRRLYLRPAHEANGNWYGWSGTPDDYVKAWRRMYEIVNLGFSKSQLQWIWSVNNTDKGGISAESYYPGDIYVDWLGMDGYNWGKSFDWGEWNSPNLVFDNMLNRLRVLSPNKPISINEVGSTSVPNGVEGKNDWIASMFDYAHTNNIKMLSWFNEDREADWAIFGGSLGNSVYQNQPVYSKYALSVSDNRIIGSDSNNPKILTDAQFDGSQICKANSSSSSSSISNSSNSSSSVLNYSSSSSSSVIPASSSSSSSSSSLSNNASSSSSAANSNSSSSSSLALASSSISSSNLSISSVSSISSSSLTPASNSSSSSTSANSSSLIVPVSSSSNSKVSSNNSSSSSLYSNSNVSSSYSNAVLSSSSSSSSTPVSSSSSSSTSVNSSSSIVPVSSSSNSKVSSNNSSLYSNSSSSSSTLSSSTSSLNSNSSTSSALRFKDLVTSSNQKISVQLINDDCLSLNYLDNYQLIVSGYSSNNFIQIKANCASITIKTIWKDISTTNFDSKNFKLVKYNPITNQIIDNYPVNVVTENINGVITLVTYHTVTDNQQGDSEIAVNNILDPYTLVYTGSTNSSSTSSAIVNPTITSTVNTINSPNGVNTINTFTQPQVINITNNNLNSNSNQNNNQTKANQNTNQVSNTTSSLDQITNNNILSINPNDKSNDNLLNKALIRTGGETNTTKLTLLILLSLVLILFVSRLRQKKKE